MHTFDSATDNLCFICLHINTKIEFLKLFSLKVFQKLKFLVPQNIFHVGIKGQSTDFSVFSITFLRKNPPKQTHTCVAQYIWH